MVLEERFLISILVDINLLYYLLVSRVILAAAFFILGFSLKKKSTSRRFLQSPFECGFSTLGEYRINFRLHFFVVALVFIIFDVELIIIFPFFMLLKRGASSEVCSFFIILVFVLTGALLNEWNQIALEWAK